jgi:GDPmannose 4,6-dehydratase
VFILEKYFRPSEVEELLGDSTKARTELGWEPIYTFDELVREMVENDC